MLHLITMFFMFVVLACYSNFSQIQITSKSGSLKTHSMDNISTILFTESALSVNGAEPGTYERSDIRKITFINDYLQPEKGMNGSFKEMSLTVSPNPCNPTTQFYIYGSLSPDATMNIFDCSGRMIRTLKLATYKEQSPHSLVWDACNKEGRQVASGTYIAVLKSGKHMLKTKVMLIR